METWEHQIAIRIYWRRRCRLRGFSCRRWSAAFWISAQQIVLVGLIITVLDIIAFAALVNATAIPTSESEWRTAF